VDRARWEREAGQVAAYRELRGHNDPTDALGPAPKPGQVEQYAAYRAAWRTLGRPEIEREELELSDGQLRVRVRAHEREAAWAPRYVGNELAGTRQAAATHRQNAALCNAEASDASDPAERERLRTEAAQARALAETLYSRAAELQIVDDARARWLAHTAGTRAAAERSKAELAARHIDDTEPEQQVTADEWLEAHRDALVEDDRHRTIIETDIAEPSIDRVDETLADAGPEPRADADLTDVPDPDIRDVAAVEPAPVDEDAVRVPTPQETADAIADANRALAEMCAREAADQQEAEHRAAELARWHATGEAAAEHDDVDDVDDVFEPVDSL